MGRKRRAVTDLTCFPLWSGWLRRSSRHASWSRSPWRITRMTRFACTFCFCAWESQNVYCLRLWLKYGTVLLESRESFWITLDLFMYFVEKQKKHSFFVEDLLYIVFTFGFQEQKLLNLIEMSDKMILLGLIVGWWVFCQKDLMEGVSVPEMRCDVNSLCFFRHCTECWMPGSWVWSWLPTSRTVTLVPVSLDVCHALR